MLFKELFAVNAEHWLQNATTMNNMKTILQKLLVVLVVFCQMELEQVVNWGHASPGGVVGV